MSEVSRVRRRIEDINRTLKGLRHDAEIASDAISHIDIDLSNTADEFAITTGRPESEYPLWRKRARWARHNRVKELATLQENIVALEEELAAVYMQLYAEEAGYSGHEERELLVAMNHMMMEVLGVTGYQPSKQQVGLLAAVSDATKGG